MTVGTQVKWRGIRRQVINYAVERRRGDQKWQTVFKRLFSSIKQAACLCQLWVWWKTIQLKRPRMFMQLQHGASCIVFCVKQPPLLFFFFFYFSHLSQNNPSPIILKHKHGRFSNLLVTSCKEDGGASRNQTNQSTSKVESEWMYWQTAKWGAVEINKCETLWDILLSLCFKCEQ